MFGVAIFKREGGFNEPYISWGLGFDKDRAHPSQFLNTIAEAQTYVENKLRDRCIQHYQAFVIDLKTHKVVAYADNVPPPIQWKKP